jgi:hypothetical protein
MAQILLSVGASIFLVLGTLHGLLLLRDLVRPRAFTPTDESVRLAMQRASIALSPRANLWQAWLGFNLSHSLGAVLFGGGLLCLAWAHFAVFTQSIALQCVSVVVAAIYLVLSIRFWFWGPALGSGVALACILGALVFS